MNIEPCTPHRLPLKTLDWGALVPLIGQAREEIARFDERLKVASVAALEALKWEEAAATLRTLDVSADRQKVEDVKEAIDFAIAWAQAKPLGIPFYCKLHARIKKRAPNPKEVGRLRSKQNWIGPQGGNIEEAYFYPPKASRVRYLLQALVRYANGPEKDPLVQSAIFFAQFLIIHPFMDGNGRVARILVPLYLAKKHILCQPYLFMSSYFAKHRLAYFQKLFYVSDKEAWENWILYFLRGVILQSQQLSLILNRSG